MNPQDLTDKQKKRLEKHIDLIKKGDVAILENIFELEETLDEKMKEMESMMAEHKKEIMASMPDITKLAEQIKGQDGKDSEVPGPKGDKGEDGKDGYTPKKNKDYFDGKDGKDGRDGKDGVSPNKNEIIREVVSLIPPAKDGKDGSPATPEDVVKKLESLKGDDRLDRKAIKGLDEELKSIRQSTPSGGVRRVFQPYLDDFTSLTDGSQKTFYLSREPLKTNTILVWGTDFPIVLRPTTDFTVSGKTFTLTSAVPAPSTGATLLIQYYA